LIVLRSSVKFPLPELSSAKLIALSDREIQEMADKNERVADRCPVTMISEEGGT
jgi:hypothetical protein